MRNVIALQGLGKEAEAALKMQNHASPADRREKKGPQMRAFLIRAKLRLTFTEINLGIPIVAKKWDQIIIFSVEANGLAVRR